MFRRRRRRKLEKPVGIRKTYHDLYGKYLVVITRSYADAVKARNILRTGDMISTGYGVTSFRIDSKKHLFGEGVLHIKLKEFWSKFGYVPIYINGRIFRKKLYNKLVQHSVAFIREQE